MAKDPRNRTYWTSDPGPGRAVWVGEGPTPTVIQVTMPQLLGALERYDEATAFLDSIIDSARSLSAPSLLVPALSIRADIGYRTGETRARCWLCL